MFIFLSPKSSLLIVGRIGSLGSGAVTNSNEGGWRYIFWMQAAFHGATSLGLFLFYWPPRHVEYPKFSFRQLLWACDPIGSLLFVSSATLMLLALDWAGGAYAWSNPHVAVPLSIGLALLVLFAVYGENSFPRKNSRAVLTTAHRMERQIGWSRCSCLLPEKSQFCTFSICICSRRLDILQRSELHCTADRSQPWLRN
jgi:hypothetical protein